MKLKFLFFLLQLGLITLPHTLIAEENKTPFTISGKPVPQIVASVNGVALTSELLEREFFSFRFQSKQNGREIDPNEEYNIALELLKTAVARELVVQKANSLGINITDQKITLQLKNIEDQFPSHKLFITALAFQHLSIQSLKEKIHRTLLEDELIRREIAPKVKVSDEEIEKYYNKNRASFTKPVLYKMRHIHIKTITSSEKAADKISQKKADRLKEMINAEAKEKIGSLLKRLQDGEDFIDLAKRFSEDDATKEKGGLLGQLHPDSTIPEISAEMVKLNEQNTSGVIKSKFGYHILKLDEIIPSQLIPFSETKSDIMNLLLKMQTQKLFTTYVENLGNNAQIEVLL
jgi:peptidyl-prolyl cis-trans isomerase SurA